MQSRAKTNPLPKGHCLMMIPADEPPRPKEPCPYEDDPFTYKKVGYVPNDSVPPYMLEQFPEYLAGEPGTLVVEMFVKRTPQIIPTDILGMVIEHCDFETARNCLFMSKALLPSVTARLWEYAKENVDKKLKSVKCPKDRMQGYLAKVRTVELYQDRLPSIAYLNALKRKFPAYQDFVVTNQYMNVRVRNRKELYATFLHGKAVEQRAASQEEQLSVSQDLIDWANGFEGAWIEQSCQVDIENKRGCCSGEFNSVLLRQPNDTSIQQLETLCVHSSSLSARWSTYFQRDEDHEEEYMEPTLLPTVASVKRFKLVPDYGIQPTQVCGLKARLPALEELDLRNSCGIAWQHLIWPLEFQDPAYAFAPSTIPLKRIRVKVDLKDINNNLEWFDRGKGDAWKLNTQLEELHIYVDHEKYSRYRTRWINHFIVEIAPRKCSVHLHTTDPRHEDSWWANNIRNNMGAAYIYNGLDPITREETYPDAKEPGEGWTTIFSSNMRYQAPLGFETKDLWEALSKAYPGQVAHGMNKESSDKSPVKSEE